MSFRLMFSPCAPIGGTTCAASATSAVRGPASRSATCAMIGQSRRGPASRSAPSTPQARAFSSASKAPASIAASSAARGPRSIQTTAEWCAPSRSGSGTSVNGPPVRWISVDTPSCGRSWVTVNASAFCPYPHRLTPMPSASRSPLSRPSAASTSRARACAPPPRRTIAPLLRAVIPSTRPGAISRAPGCAAKASAISRRSSQFGRL